MIHLKYNPAESLQLMQEVHQDNWLKEIKDYVNIIIGVSKTHKTSLNHAFNICLKITTRPATIIRYHAALHYLTNSNYIANRLNELKNELQQLTNRSGAIEVSQRISHQEKAYTRQAIYKQVGKVQFEIRRLQHAQKNISNIPFEATVIKPDGSEDSFTA